MTDRPVIVWDYDEPLFPWYDYAHDASVAAGLTTADQPPPTVWDPHSHYGCTIEEWIEVLDAEVRKGVDGMYARPLKTEAIEALEASHEAGFLNYILTSRGYLGEYGPQIQDLTRWQVETECLPVDGVFFAQDKGPTLRELGATYFLDDMPKHYTAGNEVGTHSYLLDERWNQDFVVPMVRRVDSATEFIKKVLWRVENIKASGTNLRALRPDRW